MLELVTTNAVTAMTVYGDPQGVDRIISEIENQVLNFVPDLSTIKAQQEKERIEAEKIAKQKAEDEKRRSDEEYRMRIRQETIDSLIGNAGITQQLASIIFMLIATNKIAHVKLEY